MNHNNQDRLQFNLPQGQLRHYQPATDQPGIFRQTLTALGLFLDDPPYDTGSVPLYGDLSRIAEATAEV